MSSEVVHGLAGLPGPFPRLAHRMASGLELSSHAEICSRRSCRKNHRTACPCTCVQGHNHSGHSEQIRLCSAVRGQFRRSLDREVVRNTAAPDPTRERFKVKRFEIRKPRSHLADSGQVTDVKTPTPLDVNAGHSPFERNPVVPVTTLTKSSQSEDDFRQNRPAWTTRRRLKSASWRFLCTGSRHASIVTARDGATRGKTLQKLHISACYSPNNERLVLPLTYLPEWSHRYCQRVNTGRREAGRAACF